MSTTFSFQLSEEFLTNYAAYLRALREQHPGKSYRVTLRGLN